MDPSTNGDTPSVNRKLIGIVTVAALLLCVATAVAGFAIGRATATPQATLQTATETASTSRNGSTAAEDTETAVERNSANGTQATDEGDTAAAPDAPTPLPTEPAQQAEPTAVSEPLDLDTLDTSLFNEVWGIVEGEFYGDLPSNDDLLYAAIEGSLESLDDEFTSFTRPEIAELLREDFGGSVEGIGAFVRENDDGFVEIVSPIEGQPADLAGLQPGDLVIEVDGESVVGEDFYAVIAKIRGPRGTEVTLTISRPEVEDPLTFTITRTRFEVPVVETEMLDDNIGYVQLSEFSGLASEKLTEGLEELLAQNPDALVLDLRNNPGGFLDQSVMVTDLFLPEGIVLYQRDSQGGEEIFRSETGDIAESIPLVVLINEGSASASEIVAGAIQDTGRGTLIGETTFGKGSVQLLHVLSDGSELRVTIARWFTPNNNSINGVGISPDVEAEQDFDTEVDEQLQRALEYLQTE